MSVVVPSFREEFVLRQRRKDVYYRYPQTTPLIACLNLDDYQKLSTIHSDGFLAKKIGISVDEVRPILTELESVGRIQKIDRKFIPTMDSVDLAGNDGEGIHRFMSYWLARLQRYYNGGGDWIKSFSRFGMEVFAVNEESKAIIRDEYRAFQKRVRATLHQQAQSNAPTDQIIILHSVFYDPSEVGSSEQ